jgi:acid stress chaperone HdeB
MNYLKMVLAGAAFVLPAISTTQAQTSFDFKRYTCEQFLTAPLGERVVNAAWYSGFYNGKRNNTNVDLTKFEANANAVVASCEKNTKQTVMQAADKVLKGQK